MRHLIGVPVALFLALYLVPASARQTLTVSYDLSTCRQSYEGQTQRLRGPVTIYVTAATTGKSQTATSVPRNDRGSVTFDEPFDLYRVWAQQASTQCLLEMGTVVAAMPNRAARVKVSLDRGIGDDIAHAYIFGLIGAGTTVHFFTAPASAPCLTEPPVLKPADGLHGDLLQAYPDSYAAGFLDGPSPVVAVSANGKTAVVRLKLAKTGTVGDTSTFRRLDFDAQYVLKWRTDGVLNCEP